MIYSAHFLCILWFTLFTSCTYRDLFCSVLVHLDMIIWFVLLSRKWSNVLPPQVKTCNTITHKIKIFISIEHTSYVWQKLCSHWFWYNWSISVSSSITGSAYIQIEHSFSYQHSLALLIYKYDVPLTTSIHWSSLCTNRTFLYDKRDDFNFPIVNFPFICIKISTAPAYGVYISQMIRYSRACGSYQDFLDRELLLTKKNTWKIENSH